MVGIWLLSGIWIWLIWWQIGIFGKARLQILFPMHLIPTHVKSEFCIELGLYFWAQARSVMLSCRHGVPCPLGLLYQRIWPELLEQWEEEGKESSWKGGICRAIKRPKEPHMCIFFLPLSHLSSFYPLRFLPTHSSALAFALFFSFPSYLCIFLLLSSRGMQTISYSSCEMHTVRFWGVGLIWTCLDPHQDLECTKILEII